MKLVIDIPEEEYQKVQDGRASVSMMRNAIRNGTALPEGHGRLIDADALDTSILQAGFAYSITRSKLRYTAGDMRQKIANAPTIIEADKGSEDKK